MLSHHSLKEREPHIGAANEGFHTPTGQWGTLYHPHRMFCYECGGANFPRSSQMAISQEKPHTLTWWVCPKMLIVDCCLFANPWNTDGQTKTCIYTKRHTIHIKTLIVTYNGQIHTQIHRQTDKTQLKRYLI